MCSYAHDKVTVRINNREANTVLQVLERHRFNQCRFARTGFADNVNMRKAIFTFDTEDAVVGPKIYLPHLSNAPSQHNAAHPLSD
jgi:hypothetical protein